MYLSVEANINCSAEERVFATSGPQRKVAKVLVEAPGLGHRWCDVAGVDEGGGILEATAQLAEDSADGVAWLITGGTWGLRFRLPETNEEWDLKNLNQWGVPFLVLDSGAKEIQFKS